MSADPKYSAASIQVDVKVEAFENVDDSLVRYAGAPARRTVTLSLYERFTNDADLDVAIDSFAATIREAARR